MAHTQLPASVWWQASSPSVETFFSGSHLKDQSITDSWYQMTKWWKRYKAKVILVIFLASWSWEVKILLVHDCQKIGWGGLLRCPLDLTKHSCLRWPSYSDWLAPLFSRRGGSLLVWLSLLAGTCTYTHDVQPSYIWQRLSKLVDSRITKSTCTQGKQRIKLAEMPKRYNDQSRSLGMYCTCPPLV